MARLSEEQQALAESAAEVLGAAAGRARFRALRGAGETLDGPLWAQLVALGWPAVALPEDAGGLGMGPAEAAVLAEAAGYHAAVTPLRAAWLGGALDPEAGAAEGRIVALAWQERSGDRGQDPEAIQAAVEGGRLTGRKVAVCDGTHADSFVVTARAGAAGARAFGLWRVRAEHAQIAPLRRMDHRDAAEVTFDDAPAEPLVGGRAALEALQGALDRARVMLAAESLGQARAALEMTLGYLRERVQFDQPIGSFQALQHRAVDCYVAVELARAAVHAAARDPSARLASLAKARADEAYLHVSREAIQLHGGIGMTDEHDIGFHLKRALVASQTLGTASYHRDRWASLRGY